MMLSLFILALAGFLLALFIHWKKTTQQTLICIIGKDCTAIVNSTWGKLFGVPNEILGMFYYCFIMGSTALFFFGIDFTVFVPLSAWVLIASISAALFSVFLLGVQAFIFKDWCEYCLASAGINITLFVMEAAPLLALYGLL